MTAREAHIWALRHVATHTRNAIGHIEFRYPDNQPVTNADDARLRKAFTSLADELRRRADKLDDAMGVPRG